MLTVNCSQANMAEIPAFQQRQYAFTAAIRDPEQAASPVDIEARRMKIYQQLFYNNVESFMANAFPVLRSIMAETGWHRLIRDYFSSHRASTPLFPQMPREFVHYLSEERQPQANDFPFLAELAHYEWVETALELSELEIDDSGAEPELDLLAHIPVISPLAWLLQYNYPVHRIGPDHLPQHTSGDDTFIVVYRNRHDEVKFIELNATTAILLQRIADNESRTGIQLVEDMAREMAHPDPRQVIQAGARILADMQQRQIIAGARPQHRDTRQQTN